VIGKSLGTLAAGAVAERGWRAVWLTPLLNEPSFVDMLRARTAPALLVGGTNDPAWDGDLARELSPDVLELDGADHGLAKIEHLAAIVRAIQAFLH
jgi:pimeloyl-ACP methyl ester carboxylesterase